MEARRIPAFALAGLLALAGCGGGERMDENEPEGDFRVEVLRTSFPRDQLVAQTSRLTIAVRNAGTETIPDIALTLKGLNRRSEAAGVSDPRRPAFVIDGKPVLVGGYPDARQDEPEGCATAVVDTWACGPLKPGATHVFRWTLTAVDAGRFELGWRVGAGLDGKARAVGPRGGAAPTGSFTVTVSDEPPRSRIAEDGVTVLN